ncbi:MAG: hypothetical protein GXO91_02075 [FCB group bacterium]|nr:hypothetical protein [FCB group bacterium]
MIYLQPENLQTYFELTAKTGLSDSLLLAGGTDLMPRFERGEALPATLIDLKKIPHLKSIRETRDGIEIGALTTVEDLRRHARVTSKFAALQAACEKFAGLQIRHRATVGGNICNASPAGDLLPGLLAFGAEIILESSQGSRVLPLEDFLLGPGRTALRPDELLSTVRLKDYGAQSEFHKLGLRRTMAISVVNCALVYRKTGAAVEFISITAGAVAPTVVSLNRFTEELNRDPDNLAEHLAIIDSEIAPITDIRASAAYRRKALKNILQFAILSILKKRHV